MINLLLTLVLPFHFYAHVTRSVFFVNDDENDDENDENVLNYSQRD